jgi:hypothetical protein
LRLHIFERTSLSVLSSREHRDSGLTAFALQIQ